VRKHQVRLFSVCLFACLPAVSMWGCSISGLKGFRERPSMRRSVVQSIPWWVYENHTKTQTWKLPGRKRAAFCVNKEISTLLCDAVYVPHTVEYIDITHLVWVTVILADYTSMCLCLQLSQHHTEVNRQFRQTAAHQVVCLVVVINKQRLGLNGIHIIQKICYYLR
jgi:hypothetical protein